MFSGLAYWEAQNDVNLHRSSTLSVSLHAAADAREGVDFIHQLVGEVIGQLHTSSTGDVDNLSHQFPGEGLCVWRGMQPGLGIHHSQSGEGVPRHIPYNLLPSLWLHIFEDLELCLAVLEEIGECLESLLFERAIQCWVGENANLHILGLRVLDYTRADLGGTDPGLVECQRCLKLWTDEG